MKIKDFRGGEGETFRGFAAHSRRIVVSCAKHSFTPDTPSFGSFAAQKHRTVMFLLAYPCRHRRSYEFKYPASDKKKKADTRSAFFFCERAMKRIQNPNGFILQNGFTFYRKWVHFFAKNGFKFNDRFKFYNLQTIIVSTDRWILLRYSIE